MLKSDIKQQFTTTTGTTKSHMYEYLSIFRASCSHIHIKFLNQCSKPLDSSHARSDNEETLAGVALKSFINTGESGNTYLLFFY